MKIKILSAISLTSLLLGCGGGGGGDITTAPAPIQAYTTLVVNKDGLYKTAPYVSSTNFVQNPTSGYFVSAYINQEWSGSGMQYTSGYLMPTSGRLYSFKVSDRTNSELWYAISDLNFDVSSTTPSLDSSAVAFEGLLAAKETKIFGGNNNDITLFLANTSEVDLGAGLDTLVLSQNFSVYKFNKDPSSSSNIFVIRDGRQTLVKNVESFKFANITRTLTEILATIP
jgi:hypothetical protein